MLDKKNLKNLKKALRIIGIVLFIYVLSKVNWPEFLEILREINIFYFFLSTLLIIPVIFIRTLKWRELTNSIGVRVPRKTLTLIFAKGLFLGIITPGKLGEFYRAKYLTERANVSLGKALYTVVFDKIIDFLSMAFIGILAILVLIYLFEVKMLLVAMILIFIIIFGIYLLIKREYSQKFLKLFFQIFIFDSLKKKAETFFNEFFEETKRLTRVLITKLFCYELVAYIFVVFAYFFMALSLGINIPLWYLCLIVPLVTIITAVPISVFGIGTREISFIFLLSLININLNQAVIFSFLIMFWSILSGLPGFILIYFPVKILKNGH